MRPTGPISKGPTVHERQAIALERMAELLDRIAGSADALERIANSLESLDNGSLERIADGVGGYEEL